MPSSEEESGNNNTKRPKPRRRAAAAKKPTALEIQKELEYQQEGSRYVADCLCLEYLYWSLTAILLLAVNQPYEEWYLKVRAFKTAIIGFEARVEADELPWIQENFEDLEPLNPKRSEFKSLVDRYAPYLPVWGLISNLLLELMYGMRDIPGIGERAHRQHPAASSLAMKNFKSRAPRISNSPLPKWSWAAGQLSDGVNCNLNTKDEIRLFAAFEKGPLFSHHEVQEIRERLPLSYVVNPNHKEWKSKILQEGGHEARIIKDIDSFQYFRSHLGPEDKPSTNLSLLSDLISQFMKLIGVAYKLDWKESSSFTNFKEKLVRRAEKAGEPHPFKGLDRETVSATNAEVLDETEDSDTNSLQEWLLWRASRFVLLSAVQQFALFGDVATAERYIFCFYSWGPRPSFVPTIDPDIESTDKLDKFWKDFWSQERVKRRNQLYMKRMMRTFWGDRSCHRIQQSGHSSEEDNQPLESDEDFELTNGMFKWNLKELSRQMFPENQGGEQHLPMSQGTDLGDTLAEPAMEEESQPNDEQDDKVPKWNLIPPKGYNDFYAELISFIGELASKLPEPILRYYAHERIAPSLDHKRKDLPTLSKETLTTLDQFLSGLLNSSG